MSTRLFVYGTLKRGCSNHHHMSGQCFVGAARTLPGFRLFDLGGYPGIAAHAADREGVVGEVWEVDEAALRRLDEFEGVHEGLYRRAPVALAPPFADDRLDAYFPALSVADRPDVGSEWAEPPRSRRG